MGKNNVGRIKKTIKTSSKIGRKKEKEIIGYKGRIILFNVMRNENGVIVGLGLSLVNGNNYDHIEDKKTC